MCSASYLHRGLAFDRKGDKERAISDYRKVLELVPWDDKTRDRIRQLGAEP
jgi:hypothetical protein